MPISIPKYQSIPVYFPYKHQKIQGIVATKKSNEFRSCQEKINSIGIAMALSISKTAI